MDVRDFGGLAALLERIETLAYDPATAGAATELTAAMLTVLGSGPTLAMIQAQVAANQANGLMYGSAVSQQQRSNIIAMAMTANAVRMMLESPH